MYNLHSLLGLCSLLVWCPISAIVLLSRLLHHDIMADIAHVDIAAGLENRNVCCVQLSLGLSGQLEVQG